MKRDHNPIFIEQSGVVMLETFFARSEFKTNTAGNPPLDSVRIELEILNEGNYLFPNPPFI